jgi:hypothetical protein
MFKFSARLLKRADAWDGVDTRIHQQDTHAWSKRVWTGLSQQFQTINQNYKIKGIALREWIKEYGIGTLLQSQDPAVRKATADLRTLLKDYVAHVDEGGQFRNNEIAAFKKEFGSNVTDWLYKLTGAGPRQASVKKAWTPHSQSELNFGPEPPDDPDTEYTPVDFDDVDIYVTNPAGAVEKVIQISGQIWREGDDVEVRLTPESQKALEGVDWKEQIVLEQIQEAVELPSWDDFYDAQDEARRDADADARMSDYEDY